MKKIKYALLTLVALALPTAAGAATVTYDTSGTFATIAGSTYYSALSGGSFSGSFETPSGIFPLAASTYHTYENVSDFDISLYTSTGVLFATLSGATPNSYLYITNTTIANYGGEVLDFVVDGTEDLQLIVPTTFTGTGSVEQSNSNAQYNGNYANVAAGTISAVPEPSTWAMMILGFFGVGFMAYRRKQNGPSLSVA
jgi:hypothetical protein